MGLTCAVVIPTIPPREALLHRALASVARQTRQPDEVVVELDTEGTGAGPTRNRAIERATSDYVATLDDDDELMANHLELLMKAAARTRADVVYSWFYLIYRGLIIQDRELATMWHGQLAHPLGVPFGPEQAAHMRKYAWIPACLLLRRQMVLDVGGYPPPGHPEYVLRGGCEDWALLIRMLDAGARFTHVPVRTWRLYKGAPGRPESAGGTAGRPWQEAQ